MNVFGKLQIVLIAIVLAGLGCKTVRNVPSEFQEGSIRIDGNLEDWDSGMTFHKQSGLHYQIANDNDYLYIALMSRDDVVQRKILMFGMTLWMDTTGSKEKMKGLQYPLPSKEEDRKSRLPGSEDLPLRTRRAQPENSIKTIATKALTDKMAFINLEGEGKKVYSIAEETEVKVRINRNKQLGLIYEARIPFSMLYESSVPAESDLSIGIVTGRLELPDGMQTLKPPQGMGPGGGQTGGRRGSSSGGFGSLDELQKRTELWLKNVNLTSGPP